MDLDFVDQPLDWASPQHGGADAAPPAAPQRLTSERSTRTRPQEHRRTLPGERDGVVALPIGGDPARWPVTLAEFAPWWLAEPGLDTSRGRRVPPAGPAKAAIMVLVADPERDDTDRLLSNDDGAMLNAMLQACGLRRDEVYVASVLPRHTPAADWEALAQTQLGAVLRHHLMLAAPRRLWVFGREVMTLLAPEMLDRNGVGAVSPGGPSHDLQVPVLGGYPLAAIRRRPALKRSWWERWLAFSS
ncbi:hypothetical protein RM533_03760 [Croceicoccus sp. F390]|uniref:Uracil-DNA glycosylase-like domain-containing protein n=1 Tax=Croceicoccus esteveae TaxID=3075597 RepID=A0ABU2ZG10_9SPHN|nr:uracil-DNA glycosylase family protein [Croceicoccus sp. F390]MDT0575296.1 hypothetical protein [Croceicoccus sp. F390]